MSFVIDDAITLAESWFEEELDSAQCLIWANEFLRRKASNKLWSESTEDYADKSADTWYDLPTDFFMTVKVLDENDVTYENCRMRNGKIMFASDGTYELTYVQYPEALSDTDTTDFPLPDAFLYPLAEFLIFRFYNQELDDEDSKNSAMEYEGRYLSSLKEIYSRMQINTDTEIFKPRLRW